MTIEELLELCEERKHAATQAFDAFEGDPYYAGKATAYEEVMNILIKAGVGQ